MNNTSSNFPVETEISACGVLDSGSPVPENYGQTMLVAIPKNPSWLFVYWEITSQSWQTIKKEFGENIFNNSKTILRLYEIESLADPVPLNFQDIEINLDAKNWYVTVPKECSLWKMELGFRLQNGRFIRIITSNLIQPPSVSCRTKQKNYSSFQSGNKKNF